MKEMKSLTFPNGETYEVVDEKARKDVNKMGIAEGESYDSLDPAEALEIELVKSGETRDNLFTKFTKAVSNIRWLIKEVAKLNSKTIYSKNETVCGTWIDGKPLYRKVIELGVTEANKYTYLYRSSYGLNSCKIVKLEGIAHTNEYTRPIVHAYRSDEATNISETIAVFADITGIVVVNNGIAPGTIYLTVEYVK